MHEIFKFYQYLRKCLALFLHSLSVLNGINRMGSAFIGAARMGWLDQQFPLRCPNQAHLTHTGEVNLYLTITTSNDSWPALRMKTRILVGHSVMIEWSSPSHKLLSHDPILSIGTSTSTSEGLWRVLAMELMLSLLHIASVNPVMSTHWGSDVMSTSSKKRNSIHNGNQTNDSKTTPRVIW